MPASYQISSLMGCVFVRLDGVVTNEEIVGAQREMFRDEHYNGDYPHLIYAANIIRLDLTADTVRNIAQAAARRGLRRAAMVSKSDFLYGMMRMYEAYSGEVECLVCANMEEALTWLLKPPPAAAEATQRSG